MVLSSQHNHNTEGFYLSTLKNRPKPFIDKDSSRFLKLELFLYIIKIRKNPSRPLFSRVHRVFFTPCRSPFLLLEKSRFLFALEPAPFKLPKGEPVGGKTPLRGPPWSVYLKGSPTQKDYVFFCVIKSARFCI